MEEYFKYLHNKRTGSIKTKTTRWTTSHHEGIRLDRGRGRHSYRWWLLAQAGPVSQRGPCHYWGCWWPLAQARVALGAGRVRCSLLKIKKGQLLKLQSPWCSLAQAHCAHSQAWESCADGQISLDRPRWTAPAGCAEGRSEVRSCQGSGLRSQRGWGAR